MTKVSQALSRLGFQGSVVCSPKLVVPDRLGRQAERRKEAVLCLGLQGCDVSWVALPRSVWYAETGALCHPVGHTGITLCLVTLAVTGGGVWRGPGMFAGLLFPTLCASTSWAVNLPHARLASSDLWVHGGASGAVAWRGKVVLLGEEASVT